MYLSLAQRELDPQLTIIIVIIIIIIIIITFKRATQFYENRLLKP